MLSSNKKLDNIQDTYWVFLSHKENGAFRIVFDVVGPGLANAVEKNTEKLERHVN